MSRKGLLLMEHHPWSGHPASSVCRAPWTRSLFLELSGRRRLDFWNQHYMLGFCGAGSLRRQNPRDLLVSDVGDDLSKMASPCSRG